MTEHCIHCGEVAEQHHEFEPPKRASATCCCDAREWADPTDIPVVCAAFVGDPARNCETCEHNIECHAAKVPT